MSGTFEADAAGWAEKARRLGDRLPRTSLHPRAVAFLEGRPSGEAWGVAFSGGADSLALLLLTWAHWPERRPRLVALHFNHVLRGAESDADEAHCRAVCAACGVAFLMARAEWPPAKRSPSEADARAVRLAFFDRALAEAGAGLLLTGHQRDDVAETALMRLARGSGSAGLAAPRPVQFLARERTRVRPLLSLSAQEIREALRQSGASWREDRTNAEGAYFRNRLRRDVVPAWKAAAPAKTDLAAGVACSRERLEEEDDALQTWLASLLPEFESPPMPWSLAPLSGRPRALWRRALHRWLQTHAPDLTLNRDAFEALLRAAESGGNLKLGGGGGPGVRLEKGWLFLEAAAAAVLLHEVDLPLGESRRLSTGDTVAALELAATADLLERVRAGGVSNQEAVFLDAEALFEAPLPARGELVVRSRERGDRYRPLGAPGAATLQDLFVNRRIARAERSRLPVFVSSRLGVVWAPGCPPAEAAKLTAATVRVVQLTYQRGTLTLDNHSQSPWQKLTKSGVR